MASRVRPVGCVRYVGSEPIQRTNPTQPTGLWGIMVAVSGKVLRWTWSQSVGVIAPSGLIWAVLTLVTTQRQRSSLFLQDAAFAVTAGLVFMGLALLGSRTGSVTRLDEHGASTGPSLLGRNLAWDKVESVDQRQRWGVRQVVLRGRPWMPGLAVEIPLRAPVDARLLPDPQFDAKVDEIRARWLAHREPPRLA